MIKYISLLLFILVSTDLKANQNEITSDTVSKRVLKKGEPTQEVLLIKWLMAIEAKDTNSLIAMMVTEKEYKEWIWPEEPASDPKYNIPTETAWNMFYLNSVKALYKILGQYGGKKMDFNSLSFEEPKKKYKSYVVSFKPVLITNDTNNYEYKILGIGALIQLDGLFKIYYYTDKRD